MELNTKVILLMVSKKGMELLFGLMEVDTTDNSKQIIFKVLVIMFGQTDENTKVYGKAIKCTAKEFSHGQMEENMKVNM